MGSVLAAAAALFLFVFALQLLKAGAGGIAILLRTLAVHGFVNTLGFGWLLAYAAMSGSPVAALSLTLLDGGALTTLETFAMINGSRLGASFIVLFTGFIYFLRGWRGRGVVAMGVLSMATTATIYVPAMLLGVVVLRAGWLDGVRLSSGRTVSGVIDVVYGPILAAARAQLHPAVIFVAGFVCLLLAFRLFDKVLPPVGTAELESRWSRWIDRPLTMFWLGLLVTSLTLSVSVSLSILVPLAGRGYVRRDQVIPYIMGANISTFVDTLFASLLMQTPAAFTIVLTEMLSVAVVSVLVLGLVFRPYQAALLAFNAAVTKTTQRWRFAIFVGVLAILPLSMLLV